MTPASVWASCFSPAALVSRSLHSANALSNGVWTPDRSWHNAQMQHLCRRHAATALRPCSRKLHVYSISADHSGKAAPKPTNKQTPSRRRHNQSYDCYIYRHRLKWRPSQTSATCTAGRLKTTRAMPKATGQTLSSRSGPQHAERTQAKHSHGLHSMKQKPH